MVLPSAHHPRLRRAWFDHVNECAERKLRAVLPAAVASDDCIAQLAGYLCSSFGDRQRIDYGTGHELNFVALLLCLSKLRAFSSSDAAAIVLVVFASYISLCRCLQRT
jgi:serine/threonine-protein phosphatase 2A activator